MTPGQDPRYQIAFATQTYFISDPRVGELNLFNIKVATIKNLSF